MKDIDLKLLVMNEESANVMNRNAIKFLLENYSDILERN
jgi:hypothetical protein